MCGRTACTLSPTNLVRACTHKTGSRTGAGVSKECPPAPCDKNTVSKTEGAQFDDEDDSLFLSANIPQIDQFAPKHHTAFLYTPPNLSKDKDEDTKEDGFEDDEDESFLLEASINTDMEEFSDKIVKSDSCSDSPEDSFCPVWRDAPCGGQYHPSSNIPPTAYTPVLYREPVSGNMVLQPMLWGLVPPWYTGTSPTQHGLTTNNARLEGVETSKLYRPSLSRRCVVVCDGFYEWQRGEGGKQPYLVYRRPESGRPGVDELQEYDNRSDTETKDWDGPSLLYMAGLYSTWTGPEGVPVYNYTILTRESTSLLAWLHHRMPCFLRPSDLTPWLTSPSFSSALSLLSLPTEEDISWHPVSRDVGNVRNQDLDLVKKVEAVQVNKKKTIVSSASKSLMSNWLKRTRNEADDEKGSGEENKKIK